MRDIFTIPEAPGCTFEFTVHDDNDQGAPWEQCDGHGPVREVRAYYNHPEKRPGERILHQDGRTYWLYDWQAACKLAREDKWNAEPFDAPNRIERAVQADFDYLRGWLSGQWNYVGVGVQMDDDDMSQGEFEFALWGIESSEREYIKQVARELAFELAQTRGVDTESRRKAWLGAIKEARERRHWAQRDVLTA